MSYLGSFIEGTRTFLAQAVGPSDNVTVASGAVATITLSGSIGPLTRAPRLVGVLSIDGVPDHLYLGSFSVSATASSVSVSIKLNNDGIVGDVTVASGSIKALLLVSE